MMETRKYWLVSAALLALSVSANVSVAVAQPAAVTPEASIPYSRAEALALAEKVADHQLQMLGGDPARYPFAKDSWINTGWIQGVLFVGLTDLAARTDKPQYKDAILSRGQLNHWKLGARPYHADDHVIGQAYVWAAENGAGPEAITPMKAQFDTILADPPSNVLIHPDAHSPGKIPDCSRRWCWSDALFMAPASWLELGRITGDARYTDYAKKEFMATTDFLYDKQDHLYYRDSRFFERRGPNGEKVFWSRGNGWVLAGLARSIPLLPQGDPVRNHMETVFRQMAARLIKEQKTDGNWSPSLLADPSTTRPESSGTAFFTYGLAWGIKQGLLDRQTYEPAVRKGWAALTRSVHPDGRIGYVQPVGDRPDNVSYFDTHFYGGGAFLMAATAVADLDLADGPDLTVPADLPKPQMVLNIRTSEAGQTPVYRLQQSYRVPAGHTIGDGSIAFEGLGWETELAGYRIYLDERMAVDLFGKKAPANVLHKVGIGEGDYHAMAPWGMDILKVGETVGIGGIGRLRDGKAVRLGKSEISVSLDNSDPHVARAEIRNTGLDQGKTDLVTRLSVRGGSALTRVSAASDRATTEPFVTGLIRHPGVEVIYGAEDVTGWAYVATWGKQSLADDDLGMVVYYRPDLVEGAPADDGHSLYVTFKDPKKIQYAFGFAWVQDQQGIKTVDEFKAWLWKRRLELVSE
ncbi:MAG: glycoside hydrolase family 88 protein [Asticcacaulis sp.]